MESMSVQDYLEIIALALGGVATGLVVFFVSIKLNKTRRKAAAYVLYASVIVLLISLFVIGGFEGMPLGVVSLGMFLATIILYFYAGRKPWK